MAKQQSKNNSPRAEYNKQRKRVKALINRMENRGYVIDENVLPKTPKKITEASVRKLEKINVNELAKKSRYIDTETGELLSGLSGLKLERSNRGKQSALTRKALQQAEREFWSNAQSTQEYTPKGGDIIYDNVYDTFINKISMSTPTVTSFGSKRLTQNYEASEDERVTLKALTEMVVSRDGKDTLAWRLQENADRVNDLILHVLYGSDAVRINSASRELAEIINGSELTLSAYADLSYEQEMNEDYEYPE